MSPAASQPMDDQTQQEDAFPSGLQPWATMTAEEVWQPLLSGVLQEFDHRVDLARHNKLLEQINVTTLVSADQVVLAIQQEMRSAGRMSNTLDSGRELSTVAYDLAAFTDSDGPYTLNEIYQTFSFCDKIQSIQDHATKELRQRLHAPGLLTFYNDKVLHADPELWNNSGTTLNADDEAGKQLDGMPSEHQEGEAEESHQAKERCLRARWEPPNREEMQLFLRAGVQLNHQDDAGQTLLMTTCWASYLCICEPENSQSDSESLPQKPNWSEAHPQDAAFAETVSCLCEEAPSTWSMEDLSGRMPLTLFAEVFGANLQSAAPIATLRALLDGLSVCFSKAPSSIIWAIRRSDSLRNAAETLSRFFMKEQLTLPTQLTRLLLWMEVVMGGAWEVSEDQRHLTERLLLDSVTLDIEDMMDSAIRLREFSDQMEKKVEEWEAEEAELKLAEFEARCAKKASQYEDRIARLESEIARRAGNLQLLPQLQPSPQEVEEKKEREDVDEDAKVEEKPAQKKPVAKPQGRVLEEAKQIVEDIRADRLVNSGWDEGISEEVKGGLLAMRRSLCAAVERLAMDLYADECHCLWELMQNADDNKYAGESVIPELTLALEVDEEHGAYVWTSNNEIGLSSEDVRAICNVNASLKGAGQTGHKGIGWKSVFRISDCPHVLSNAFAFKFDTRGPLGKLALVTPTNLSDEEVDALPAGVREAKAAGNTVMFLPLRSKSDALAVDVELRHIAAQHLCLAFLRRLRRVRLRFTEGSMLLQRSEADLAKLYFPGASNLVAVKITEFTQAGEKRVQMPEYVLHHHDVALPSETVVLTLAFPVAFALDTTQGSEEDEELFKAPLQPLFTFLPVKVVGFRFAIQGPFDLTADRGNLHGKSQRNRSLCASIPLAFQAALQSLPGLRSRALDLLGQETPEATWLLVRGQLLEVLKDVECIPTEPDGQLARPGECLLPSEEPKLSEAMQHLPPDILWDHCQRRLVQRPWALHHRAQTQGLGIEEFGIDHWLQVLQVDTVGNGKRSLVAEAAQKEDHGFFKRLYPLLGTALADKPEVLEQLRKVPLLPDAAGNVLRVSDGPIFSCYASDIPKSWQKKLEAAGALRVLSDKVHSGLEATGHRFLRQLGVSRPTRQSIVPVCVRWHLDDAHFQSGGSSSSKAVPRPANDTDPEAKGVGTSSETLRCAVWASLACLRQHFLTGATGVTSLEEKEEVPWSDLGRLRVPSSSIRSGYGPCVRLTCPTYFGEAAGSELQQDVLVAIMGFIYGVEAEVRDIGVFADAPPSWLREEKEKDASKDASKDSSSVTDKLNWEAFLDVLGMKPLSPCSFHRKVAGTILTIDLGWRLSSCDWWRAVCASSTAHSYVERRLKNVDRVELTWLRQLRTPERVDVSELFLRSTYVRYGGHFLPYMDIAEESKALGCLQRLQVATELNGPGLWKCLRVLQLRRCHDISVFADLYAALQALPKAEQSSMNSLGAQEDPGQFQVFLPPSSFEAAQKCLWTDDGRSCVRWLCGYHVLQPEYGRFGSACRSWLLGPHVGVRQDLNSLEASDFLKALRSLVEQADIASRLPVEERQKRLAGRDSPSAAVFLEELQSTAVHIYKYLAKCCTENEEERSRATGTTALAFQHEALIVLADKDWTKPKRLKTHEAFWDVHPDLASSKAAKLALKGRLPSDDLDLLKKFFVDVVGIPESLTQQDLEARLRVPLSQDPPQESSWQEGFGLQDFEDFATVRRGPGVLGPGAGEEDFFRPANPGEMGSSYMDSSGYPTSGTAAPGAAGDGVGASSSQEARSSPEEGSSRQAADADVAPEASGSAGPVADSALSAEHQAIDEEEEPEEEDFDWDGEDANDPYKVLRVEKDASDESIKRAYKKLALKYHPDKNRGSEIAQKRFQVIAAAYETLRDPERRRAYDEAAAARKYASEEPQPQPEAPKVSVERAREMFRSFFGEREAAPEVSRPADSSRAESSPRAESSHRAPASSGKKQTLSKEEYDQLLNQLKEAEETAKMWNDEVEVARQQLQEAEATRDRYLRILQECYDRTTRRS